MVNPQRQSPPKEQWITLRIKPELYKRALSYYEAWHEMHPGKSFSEWVRSLIRKELGQR